MYGNGLSSQSVSHSFIGGSKQSLKYLNIDTQGGGRIFYFFFRDRGTAEGDPCHFTKEKKNSKTRSVA